MAVTSGVHREEPQGWLLRPISLLLAVILLAGGLRLFQLGSESLGLDEAISAFFAQESLSQILVESGPQRNNPPLYWLLLHAWVRILGNSEAALRGLSALFGILAVGAVYAAGKELFDRFEGLIAACLSAISVFHVYYSQEARNYSLLLCLSVMSFVYFIRILKRGQKKDYTAYVLVNLFLGYTHIYGAFILAAQLVFWGLYASKYRSRRRGLLVSWAATSIGLLPLLYLLGPKTVKIAQQGFWLPPPSGQSLLENLATFSGSGSNRHWALFFYSLLIFVGFGSGLIQNRRSLTRAVPGGSGEDSVGMLLRPCEKNTLLLLWLAFPLGLPYLLSLFMTPILHPRYTIGASAAFLLLAAQGIRSFKSRWITAGLLIGLALLASDGLYGYYSQDVKPQWRDATRLIQRYSQPNDVILLHRYFITNPFLYYYQPEIPFFRIDGIQDEIFFEGFLQNITAGKRRLWLIQSGGGEDPRMLPFLIAKYGKGALRKQKELVQIRIYLFDLSSIEDGLPPKP